jgi:DNA-binding NtrC family response regulator
MTALTSHRWPGNVRELRNVVEAMLAMGEPPTLEAAAARAGADAALDLPYKDARREVLEAFEKRYVERLLERSGGNVSAAARAGQMDRTYLIKLKERHRKE